MLIFQGVKFSHWPSKAAHPSPQPWAWTPQRDFAPCSGPRAAPWNGKHPNFTEKKHGDFSRFFFRFFFFNTDFFMFCFLIGFCYGLLWIFFLVCFYFIFFVFNFCCLGFTFLISGPFVVSISISRSFRRHIF